jgi:hypothetical protein
MSTPCTRPCPAIRSIEGDRDALCAHLLDGAACVDSWLALARLVGTARQRLDCLERAHKLAPGDRDIEVAMLEAHCALNAGDARAAERLRELRALQAITGHIPRSWRPRDSAPALGTLLLQEAVVSEAELRRALQIQREQRHTGARKLLGDLLVERGIITPAALVRILMRQFHERRLRTEGPYSIGEYLVVAGVISERQLASALLEQTQLRQVGRNESIGAILVRSGLVDVATVQRAITTLDETAMRSMV